MFKCSKLTLILEINSVFFSTLIKQKKTPFPEIFFTIAVLIMFILVHILPHTTLPEIHVKGCVWSSTRTFKFINADTYVATILSVFFRPCTLVILSGCESSHLLAGYSPIWRQRFSQSPTPNHLMYARIPASPSGLGGNEY